MLSYQHGYHAGNLADVHKHALLAVMLEYLTRKDKPLSYLETHSGRGLYALDAPEAQKTGEAAQGILRVAGWFAADHPYARVLADTRARFGANAYPGSPLIAAQMLRATDRLTLAELHPQEHAQLQGVAGPFGATVLREDGLKMALARTPPTPRRGLLLIDPSYEVKDDYATLPRFVASTHARWNVGTIALWYPILSSGAHRPMLLSLEAADLPRTLRHEVAFPPAREGHGMVGSGMLILNTPYGTEDEAQRLTRRFSGLRG